MNVSAVNPQPTVRKNNKLKAAKNGALITSGFLTASTGISWVTKKTEMQNIVKECGGNGKYSANFIMGLGILSAAGALLNTVLYTVTDKFVNKSHNKTPKAAN